MTAWRQFFALRHLLCNNDVAFKYRLRLLSSCVLSSMYWCSCSWILTCTQCTHLRAVLDRMLRKMIYVARGNEESEESHMIRWSSLIRNCRTRHEFLHGDETHFAQYFSWCGQEQEMRREILEERQVKCMYMNKNIAWLRDKKKDLGTQCRGRRFRVWRWEQAVAQCVGDKWTEKTQKNTGWREKQEEMIC